MTKTRGKVQDTADTVRPYIERAIMDEKIRGEVLRAFNTARDIYSDLMGDKGVLDRGQQIFGLAQPQTQGVERERLLPLQGEHLTHDHVALARVLVVRFDDDAGERLPDPTGQ